MKRTFSRFRDLNEEDFRVLSSIEAGLRRSEYVPVETLLKYTRLDSPDLGYRLKRLDDMRLIQARGRPYKGYRLLHTGYDFLALNVLVQRDEVESMGDRLAVGKESEVYEALGPGGSPMVIKFHRLGITSFHKTTRLRPYTGDRRHFSWVYAARLAAEREFEALTRLKNEIRVPLPMDQNRNAVLMSRFDGMELVGCDPGQPEALLESILQAACESAGQGIIHGDLSEYNVLINEKDFVIIDWPQWVETSHPQAGSIFERDLRNIFNFFGGKLQTDVENRLAEILGSTHSWSRRDT